MKRYIYSSGLDVVAPLKCGTRWLEEFDVKNRIKTFGFHPTDLPNHIHSGTTFIWRPVREHFISAVQTESKLGPDRSILDIITEIESGDCGHFRPHLYGKLYPLWEKTPFRFHKLRALSELTPSAGELRWNSTMYRFPNPNGWDSVQSVLSSLSPKHLIRIERLISEEERWLKSMLQSQYGGKSWEDYSDLEDSRLEMLGKIMNLREEAELNYQIMENRFKHTQIRNSELTSELYNEIKVLKLKNTKLQAKLDYSESVFGKPPTKLI